MPLSLTRRRFLATAVGALGAAAAGDGFLVEPGAVQVTRHDIPVAGLAPPLDGLRIACVTDVHLSHGVPRSGHVTLERLAHERPDVVVLIGDICNAWEDLATLAAWSRHARGSAAAFATLGNWEHSAGIDRSRAERAYAQAGVELLYNSTGRVTRGGATLTFVGLDDPVQGTPDLAAGLATVRSGEQTIWIVHAPGYVDGVPRDAAPRPAAILTSGRPIRRSGAAASWRAGTATRSRRCTCRAASGPSPPRCGCSARPSCRFSRCGPAEASESLSSPAPPPPLRA